MTAASNDLYGLWVVVGGGAWCARVIVMTTVCQYGGARVVVVLSQEFL